MKKNLIQALALAITLGLALAGSAFAQDKGPAEVVLGADGHKPIVFPHAQHQAKFECKTCHHTKGADGKQAPLAEGQKPEKCETCHNKTSGNPLKSLKDVGHKLCKDCHKKTDHKMAKCGYCHDHKPKK